MAAKSSWLRPSLQSFKLFLWPKINNYNNQYLIFHKYKLLTTFHENFGRIPLIQPPWQAVKKSRASHRQPGSSLPQLCERWKIILCILHSFDWHCHNPLFTPLCAVPSWVPSGVLIGKYKIAVKTSKKPPEASERPLSRHIWLSNYQDCHNIFGTPFIWQTTFLLLRFLITCINRIWIIH